VACAAEEVRQAFAVRQKLDDEVPEDPFTRERLLAEIVGHLNRAKQLLDAQHDRVATLRDQQRRAPEVVAQLGTQAEALRGRLAGAGATLQRLADYAPVSWQSVAGNVA